MRNCVETYWMEILSGQMYFYHWEGDEKATVNIVFMPKAGWQIQEALGVGNSEISESTFKDIQSHIEFR